MRTSVVLCIFFLIPFSLINSIYSVDPHEHWTTEIPKFTNANLEEKITILERLLGRPLRDGELSDLSHDGDIERVFKKLFFTTTNDNQEERGKENQDPSE